MSARTEAYAAYMKDIYTQYDRFAAVLESSSPIRLSVAEDEPSTLIGSLEGSDIMELVFLVLMETSKGAQEDLKAVMDEVKAINQVKKRLRDSLERLNEGITDHSDKPATDEHNPGRHSGDMQPCAALDTDLFVQTMFLIAARQSDHKLETLAYESKLLGERKQIAEATQASRDQLDALDEMSELASLRLQMLMDRRSKFIEVLTNIMKKMADTQDAIVANLK